MVSTGPVRKLNTIDTRVALRHAKAMSHFAPPLVYQWDTNGAGQVAQLYPVRKCDSHVDELTNAAIIYTQS